MSKDEKAKRVFEGLKESDWDDLELDVVSKLRLLRSIVKYLQWNSKSAPMIREGVIPLMALLARFCDCVQFVDSSETKISSPQPPVPDQPGSHLNN